MKIVIMCGGRGKRLGSLGKEVPKTLLPLREKSILEMKLDRYFQQNYNHFILCTGYKGELVKKAVEKYASKAKIEFSYAGEEAGILKRLYHARKLLSSKVIMTYGDTYTDISLKNLVKRHDDSQNEVTIVVAPIESPFGLVEFDHRYKATFFQEKPILNYYIGYAVINRTALDYVPAKVMDMPDGEGLVTFYKILMAMEKLGVFYHSGLQVTFNTQDELKMAEQKLKFYTTPEER